MTIEAKTSVNPEDLVAVSINSARDVEGFDDLGENDKATMFMLASALMNHLIRGTKVDELTFLGAITDADRTGLDMDMVGEYSSKIVEAIEERQLS